MPAVRPARLPPESPPRLVVLIDVEEEFDWSGGFDRQATGTAHVERLRRADAVFAEHGIVPTGLLTYPVVDRPASAAVIAELVAAGRMVPGAHLHPWVTPPHDEPVNDRNSFPGNLPRDLERAKLAALTERIEQALGQRPRVYQAGRYGLGEATRALLTEAGYRVDTSVCPPFDYRPEGGPDWSRASNDPEWHGPLLSIPVTGAFVGAARRLAPGLYRLAGRRPLRPLRGRALLARSHLAERIRLSPEGQEPADMLRLVRHLMARGCRVFSFSFHSPSLLPGCTSYVRDEAQASAFLDSFRRFFEGFFGELGGRPATPLELADELAALPGGAPPS